MEQSRWMARAAALPVSLLLLASLATHAQPPVSGHEQRAHGEQVFAASGCSHCHGAEAHGTERGPSLAGAYKHSGRKQVEKQIRAGGKQMPPFGDVLNDEDMRALLAYLKQVK